MRIWLKKVVYQAELVRMSRKACYQVVLIQTYDKNVIFKLYLFIEAASTKVANCKGFTCKLRDNRSDLLRVSSLAPGKQWA